MSLALIVAMTDARVIGRDNALPWHLPEDLKRFKTITMGHPIIMGRRTFESIARPLPGRRNIVVTSRPIGTPGLQTAQGLSQALALCPPEEGEKFVIGGARLFEEALPLADRLYLTLVHADIPGDVFFPEIDLEKNFQISERIRSAAPGTAFDVEYLTATRVGAVEHEPSFSENV